MNPILEDLLSRQRGHQEIKYQVFLEVFLSITYFLSVKKILFYSYIQMSTTKQELKSSNGMLSASEDCFHLAFILAALWQPSGQIKSVSAPSE